MSTTSLTELLNGASIDPNDPLAMPAGQLKEPTFPVLREGVKRVVLKSLSLIRAEDGNERVSLKLATQEADMDTDGRPTGPGFSFYDTIFVTPNQWSTRKEIAEELGMLIKAFDGANSTMTILEALRSPSPLLERVADCYVKVQTNKKSGRVNNTVSRWIVPKS